MRTMRSHGTLGTLALLAALPLVSSCSTAPVGEIVIAIRTDIAIPKDVDRIIVDVTLAKSGESKFNVEYDALQPDHTFKLPATLALTASKTDPGAAVRVRVLALHGDGSPRMIREVVTTVPTDRAATLPIPIEFLCDGTAVVVTDATTGKPITDKEGNLVFKSTCDDGMTCSAGKCVDVNLPEVSLADYSGGLVFGGGTGNQDGDCFDAASCFDDATIADVNTGNCTIQAGNDVNVALLTQGAGSCGPSGCFVPLDAESDAGWQPDKNGALRLPPAVCEKLKSHALGAVVTVAAGKSPCARKQASLPICGPFSSAGKYVAPSTTAPLVVASSQQNPVALGLEEINGTSRVYWTTRGTFDANSNPRSDGAVKRALTTGGEAEILAKDQASPHDLVISASKGYAFWTSASGNAIMSSPLAKPAAAPLIPMLARPEGLALDGLTMVWTDLTSNQVSQVPLTVSDMMLTYDKTPPTVLMAPSPSAGAPRRVVAANGLRCWTYEDTLGSKLGVVACNDGTTSTAVAQMQSTPRAIALVPAGSPGAGTVYFANFADHSAGGGVFSVSSDGSGLADLTKGLADGEDYPGGIAVDGAAVYWTSRTRGAVMRLKGGALTEIASHQRNPGAIVVGTDAVFWVNEGSVDKADGAIVRHAK